MRADEGGEGVAGDQPLELLDQGGEGRKSRAMEMPVGVLAQLLPALIGAVKGLEEGHGIGYMDQHGHSQSGGSLPEVGQATVVDGNQAILTITIAQAQSLPHLEPPRTPVHTILQLPGHTSAEVWLGDHSPVAMSEGHEAIGVGTVVAIEIGLQLIAPHAVQVDDGLDIALVENAQHVSYS